jgi:pimeloyl-ACP methyl ester carboxylesterase
MKSRHVIPFLLLLSPPTVLVGCQWMRDSSLHHAGYVRVRDGTRLHYLDWGGHGPTLVLLAGLGGSAHTFDDLAPHLTDSFRVIAITRRGTGESDRPTTGYDVPSRAHDDLDVLDSLKIRSALFVGHSIAGDELTELATKYPQRVAALLYLDAAYDRSTAPPIGQSDPARLVIRAPQVQTFDQLLDSRRHSPLGLPRAMETDAWKTARGKDGELISSPPLPLTLEMLLQAKQWHPDYRDIKAPVTAIYAFDPERPLAKVLLSPSDSAENRKWNELWQSEHWAWQRQEIERLKREDPSARVIVLRPANHLVYFSNTREVLAAIRAFLPKAVSGTRPSPQPPAGPPAAPGR